MYDCKVWLARYSHLDWRGDGVFAALDLGWGMGLQGIGISAEREEGG